MSLHVSLTFSEKVTFKVQLFWSRQWVQLNNSHNFFLHDWVVVTWQVLTTVTHTHR